MRRKFEPEGTLASINPLIRADSRDMVARYAIAIVSVALATMAAFLLRQSHPSMPLSPFLPAVLLTLFYGGIGPGYLAAVLCSLATCGLHLTSENGINMPDVLRNLIATGGFLLTCLLLQLRERQVHTRVEGLLAAMEQAVGGVVRLHTSGLIIQCNKTFADIVGKPPETLPRLRLSELIVHEDCERLQLALKTCRAQQRADVDLRVRWQWAAPHDVRMIILRAESPEGRPIGFYCFVRDISVRKQELEQLRQSHERLEIAFLHSLIAKAVANRDGRIVEANKLCCEMAGYTEEDLIGRDFLELIWPTDLPEQRTRFQKLVQGDMDHVTFDCRMCTKTGEMLWAHMHVDASHDENGKPEYFFVQARELLRNDASVPPLAVAVDAVGIGPRLPQAPSQWSSAHLEPLKLMPR